MSSKEFKKLNKAELLEVIYRMQQHEKSLSQDLAVWKEKAEERYDKLSQAGDIAQAALSIHDVFTSAQKAAEDYVSTVSSRAEQKEHKAQQLLTRVHTIAQQLREFLGEMDGEDMGLDTVRLQLDLIVEEVSGYLPLPASDDAPTGDCL